MKQSKRTVFTPVERQRQVIEVRKHMKAHPKATIDKACRAAGVSVSNYYNWRKDPVVTSRLPVSDDKRSVERAPLLVSKGAALPGMPDGQVFVAFGSAKEVERAIELMLQSRGNA